MVRTDCAPGSGFLATLVALGTTFLLLCLANYNFLKCFFEEWFECNNKKQISKTRRNNVNRSSVEIARIKIARAVTGISWMIMCLLFIPMVVAQSRWIKPSFWFYLLMLAQSIAFCSGTVSLTLFQLFKLVDTFRDTAMELDQTSIRMYQCAAMAEAIGILTFVTVNAIVDSDESSIVLLGCAMLSIISFQGSFFAVTIQFGSRLMTILTQASVDPTSPAYGTVTTANVNPNRKLSVRDFEMSQRPILRASARETLLSAWITVGTLGIGAASLIFAVNDCFNVSGFLAMGILMPLSWLDICICAVYLGNNYNSRQAYIYWCQSCDQSCSRGAAKLATYMQSAKLEKHMNHENSQKLQQMIKMGTQMVPQNSESPEPYVE